MAYEVTATRKRPVLFDELAGQEFVVSTLKSSITSGRIAHAYLFSGPRGVGKTSAARILARALNCEKGPTETPCGQCSACTEISRGNSLDVIEIDGASNTSVNDVREIKDEVLFSPNSARYKIYIIDEVHMLSNSAFNALLKTIEEPPPYIVFIFATTEIHKVPATIRSRCQQFNFRLIPAETIKKLLAGLCEELDVTAEEGALSWIAKEATGSLRDAYTLFDQIVSFSGAEITLAGIRDTLGLAGFDRMTAIAEACAAGEGRGVIELADETLAAGVSVEQLAMELAEYFRSLLFLKHGIVQESLLGYSSDRFSAGALATFTVAQLEQAVDLLLELYRNLRYSLNQRLELELTLSRLAALAGYLTPREILAQVQSLRRELGGASTESSGPPVWRPETATPGRALRPQATAQERVADVPIANAGVRPAAPPPRALPKEAPPPRASLRTADSGGQRPSGASAGPAPAKPTARAGARPPIVEAEDEEPDPEGWEGSGDEREPESGLQGSASAPSEGENVPSPADGVRAQVIGALRKSKLALSSALDSAIGWELDADTLTILFESGYTANKVREDVQTVLDAVQQCIGRKVKIVVQVKGGTGSSERGPRDEQIELVKRVFRGEVIKGGDA